MWFLRLDQIYYLIVSNRTGLKEILMTMCECYSPSATSRKKTGDKVAAYNYYRLPLPAFNSEGTVWPDQDGGRSLDLRDASQVGEMFNSQLWRGSRPETTAEEDALANTVAHLARLSRWGNAEQSATIHGHGEDSVMYAILDIGRTLRFDMKHAAEDMLVSARYEATDRDWEELLEGVPDNGLAAFHEMTDAHDRTFGVALEDDGAVSEAVWSAFTTQIAVRREVDL